MYSVPDVFVTVTQVPGLPLTSGARCNLKPVTPAENELSSYQVRPAWLAKALPERTGASGGKTLICAASEGPDIPEALKARTRYQLVEYAMAFVSVNSP